MAKVLTDYNPIMSIGLLFSGQGAQSIGMGRSLYENSAIARKYFDEANRVLGYDFKKICFEGPESELTQTKVCQPALYVHGYVIFKILEESGKLKNFKAALGLSLGELTALAVAGVYDFETGLKIVAERGRLMQEACESTHGSMASLLGAELELVESLAKEFDVDVSNLNCPGQIVVSGEKAKVEALVAAAKERGKKAIQLNVAGAYHSRLMESARKAFEAYLAPIHFNKPNVTVFTNVTGKEISDPAAIKQALAQQVVSTVRWDECMQHAQALGITTFYECGPGTVLTGLAKRISKDLNVQAIGEYQQLPSCNCESTCEA